MRRGLPKCEGAHVLRFGLQLQPAVMTCHVHVAFDIRLFQGPFALMFSSHLLRVFYPAKSRFESRAEKIDVHLAIGLLRFLTARHGPIS